MILELGTLICQTTFVILISGSHLRMNFADTFKILEYLVKTSAFWFKVFIFIILKTVFPSGELPKYSHKTNSRVLSIRVILVLFSICLDVDEFKNWRAYGKKEMSVAWAAKRRDKQKQKSDY